MGGWVRLLQGDAIGKDKCIITGVYQTCLHCTHWLGRFTPPVRLGILILIEYGTVFNIFFRHSVTHWDLCVMVSPIGVFV